MLRLNRLHHDSSTAASAPLHAGTSNAAASLPRLALTVEGQITGEWAMLLERECRAILAAEGSLWLDLGAVTYIDRTGIDVLTRLVRGSVELVNCLPLIEELLARSSR